MSYDTDIECGEELAQDIEDGLIAEEQLTPAGRKKLALARAARENDFSDLLIKEETCFTESKKQQ